MNASALKAAIVCVVAIVPQCSLLAAGNRTADHVKVALTAKQFGLDGKVKVTVTLDVEDGYYIYANPVGTKELDHVQAKVEVLSEGKPVSLEAAYPPATKTIQNQLVGAYHIYTGTVVIEAVFQRPDDVELPVVSITMQGFPLHNSY